MKTNGTDKPAARRQIDVAHLPDGAMDWDDPLWWGNALMLMIETTTVALLLAAYYYLRRNYDVFPPPRWEAPVMFDTAPDRFVATVNTVLLLASVGFVYWLNQAARARRELATRVGLAVMVVVAAASLILSFYEFGSLRFSWGDNAYASVCWTTVAMHLLYVLVGLCEYGLLLAWALTHSMDERHDLDVTLVGGYWYWVAGIWVPIYVTIWYAPSLLR